MLCCWPVSEYEHLERILLDAISKTPVDDEDESVDETGSAASKSKYQKYYTKEYKSQPHEYLEDDWNQSGSKFIVGNIKYHFYILLTKPHEYRLYCLVFMRFF